LIKIAAAEDMNAVVDTDVKRKIYCNLCVLSIYSETHAAFTQGHLPTKKPEKTTLTKGPLKYQGM
jgi:hypothetical protein